MKINGKEVGDTPVEMLGHMIKRSGGLPADAKALLISKGGFTKAEIGQAVRQALGKKTKPAKTRNDALSTLAQRMRKGK